MEYWTSSHVLEMDFILLFDGGGELLIIWCIVLGLMCLCDVELLCSGFETENFLVRPCNNPYFSNLFLTPSS